METFFIVFNNSILLEVENSQRFINQIGRVDQIVTQCHWNQKDQKSFYSI